jgi:hypothetical protein
MADARLPASKSIRLDDGTEIRLDDAIEKAKSHPRWPEWCSSELAEWYGLPGLSAEEAGKWLLSMGSPMDIWRRRWERTLKIWGSKPGGTDYMNEICNEFRKREPLRDEILEHIKAEREAALKREEAERLAKLAGEKARMKAEREARKRDEEERQAKAAEAARLKAARRRANAAARKKAEEQRAQEELLLEAKLRAAITGATTKEGKALNRNTGPKKVQDWWREHTEPKVRESWQRIKGRDVPRQEDIRDLMPKRPQGRPPKII